MTSCSDRESWCGYGPTRALLARRVGKGEGRPLLGDEPAARLADLYEVRKPLYESVADVTIDVDGLTPDQVIDRLLAEPVLADRGIGAA